MGKRLTDRVLVFGTGASFYSLLETLWRGHTHWSMSVTGGLVLLTVYTAERRTHSSLWRRCLRVAGIITAYEFAVGCLVNLRLGWRVWDYSSQPGMCWGRYVRISAFCGWYFLCPFCCCAAGCGTTWSRSCPVKEGCAGDRRNLLFFCEEM